MCAKLVLVTSIVLAIPELCILKSMASQHLFAVKLQVEHCQLIALTDRRLDGWSLKDCIRDKSVSVGSEELAQNFGVQMLEVSCKWCQLAACAED